MAIDFEKLTQARKELNLTKKDAADVLNIPARTYASYELGERDLSTEALLKICKTFGLSADELLGMEESPVTRKIATINGKLVYMIPIFELDSDEFKDNFIDCMPWFFNDMNEAKTTFAVKASGDSMFPKIENNDTLIIYKQKHFRDDDIILFKKDGNNYLRKVNKPRGRFVLEAVNPTYPPIDATGDLIKKIEIIGVARKIIKNL